MCELCLLPPWQVIFSPSLMKTLFANQAVGFRDTVLRGEAEPLVTLLNRPIVPVSFGKPWVETYEENQVVDLNYSSSSSSFATFFALHDAILDNLDYSDVVRLSLTCSYMWLNGHRHLLARQIEYLGAFAGQNLVLYDERHRKMQLPPTVVSILEKKFPKTIAEEGREAINQLARDAKPTTFSVHSYKLIDDMATYKDLDKIPEGIRLHMLGALHHSDSKYIPGSKIWVLRNLTKKEYTNRILVSYNLKDCSPLYESGRNFGFGAILASQICWTAKDRVDTAEEIQMHRGEWAGDAFDITTWERHVAEQKEEFIWDEGERIYKQAKAWKDVTEKLTQRLAAVWKLDRECVHRQHESDVPDLCESSDIDDTWLKSPSDGDRDSE